MGERLVKLADGLYARYYPSGKRALQIQFFYRGARCRETFKGLDPEVKAHVRVAMHRVGAIQDAIAKGTFNYVEFFPDSKRAKLFGHGSSRTVREVGDSWLRDMKISCPHSTYRSYEGPMHRFVYPAIGAMRVRDVTPEHIRDMFRDSNLTLKTARNYSIPLRALLQRALEDGDITSNPMARVKIKSLIPQEKHRSEYEPDPLSIDEIERFLAACREHRPKWLPFFTVAFYTGLRTSELYGLRWADWRGDELDVQRAVVERKEKIPKTKRSKRTVLLSPAAVAGLKAQREQTAFREYIFWNPNTGGPLVEYEVSQRAFDYICRKAGVRRRNQYQTRHTYASNMLMQGENPLFVARQMGHANVHTLFRVYARWIRNVGSYVPRGDFGQTTKQESR